MSPDPDPRRAAADPHRPAYHFVAPAGWLNDPNGLGRWGEDYHLFYQYNPHASVHGEVRGTTYWGHARGTDLLHWEDLPVALAPGTEPDAPDRDGCWSGVLVDDGGVPTLVYSGHRRDVGQRTCLATGDPADRRLATWTKHPGNPVVADKPAGLTEFRDHCVWREDGRWRQVVSAGVEGRGGAAWLYDSPDLRSWEPVGPLALGDEPGAVWECVDLFPLGGQHVLVHSVWVEGVTVHSAYAVGTYAGDTFTPRTSGLLDLGLRHFYAPQSFSDRGRRVVVGWVQEGRTDDACEAAGWSGALAVPRVASLDASGDLVLEPVAELERLRVRPTGVATPGLEPGEERVLPGVSGDQLDLDLQVRLPPGSAVALAVRRSPRGEEQTVVVLDATDEDPDTATLSLDRSRSGLDTTLDTTPLGGPVRVGPDRLVPLRVLVDHSVLEVFAGGRCLTARAYPTRRDALGVSVRAVAGHPVVSGVAWEVRGVWDGPRELWPR